MRRSRRSESRLRVARPFEREPGCLGSGKALILVGAHAPDSLLVRLRVEPKSAGRAGWLQQPVAQLPRAQELWTDADAPAQLTDSQMPFAHAYQLTEPRRCLYAHLTGYSIACTKSRRNLDREE